MTSLVNKYTKRGIRVKVVKRIANKFTKIPIPQKNRLKGGFAVYKRLGVVPFELQRHS